MDTRHIVFIVLTITVIIISRRNLLKVKSHGFYRLFSWIAIVWLFSTRYEVWFHEAFKWHQILSWTLLILSAYFVIAGISEFMRKGKPSSERIDSTLMNFEKTTGLIDTGVYRYIRHPLYSSLIFLTWGIYLKIPDLSGLAAAAFSTVFLYITSRYDEKECIIYFGKDYEKYMMKSRMFIPFIF